MKTLLTTTAIAIALAASAGSALADTNDKKIALSNNYAGNSWRQAMLQELGHGHQAGGRRQASSPRPTRSPPPRTR